MSRNTSRASLLTAMGLPPDDETVQFAEPEGLLPSAETLDTSKAQLAGAPGPAQVQAALSEGDAAHHDRLASELKLLPGINATAMYIRVQGLPSGLAAQLHHRGSEPGLDPLGVGGVVLQIPRGVGAGGRCAVTD